MEKTSKELEAIFHISQTACDDYLAEMYEKKLVNDSEAQEKMRKLIELMEQNRKNVIAKYRETLFVTGYYNETRRKTDK